MMNQPDAQPSSTERQRENAILWPIVADCGTTLGLLAFGILTGSLTLLSEGVRSTVMLTASIFGYGVMRAMHRQRLGHYEFGVGKIEQFVTLFIGIALLASGLWVASSAISRLFGEGQIAGPLGLALAAIVNAVNALINVLGWLSMKFASGQNDRDVFRAQVRARFIMMMSSLFLQVTLTIAALARDAGLAHLLDVVGAGFVAAIMVFNSIKLIGTAMPQLLDTAVDEDLKDRIHSVVSKHVPQHLISFLRTRRLGDRTVTQVGLTGSSEETPAQLARQREDIVESLTSAGLNADVALVLTERPG